MIERDNIESEPNCQPNLSIEQENHARAILRYVSAF